MDETEDSGLVNALSKAKRACVRVRWVLICATVLFACGWGDLPDSFGNRLRRAWPAVFCFIGVSPMLWIACAGSVHGYAPGFLGRDQRRKTILVTPSRSAELYRSCSTCLCGRRVTFYGWLVI